MSASITLLDKYKKATGVTSDNACAHALGVGRAAVSRWRNGDGHPDADLIAAMCDATGEALAHWLPLIEADRARTPEARKVWLRLAQAAAAITLMVCLHKNGAHTQLAMVFAAHNSGTLYIMSNWIRSLRTAGTRLAAWMFRTHVVTAPVSMPQLQEL